MAKRVRKKKLAGLILMGFVSGEEVWMFVPDSKNVAIVHAISPQILAICIRKQSEEMGVKLTYNKLPDDLLVIDGVEINARRLSQAEIQEFAGCFGEAKTTLHFEHVSTSDQYQGASASA